MSEVTNPYAWPDGSLDSPGGAAKVRGIGTDTIELEFEVTALDHEAYVEHCLASPAFAKSLRRAQVRTAFASALSIATGAAWFRIAGGDSESATVLLGIGGLVAVAVVLALPHGRREDMRRTYAKWRLGETAWQVLGPRRVTCSPARFHWWSPWNEVRVSWAAVDPVDVGTEGAYIPAPTHYCYMVPRRAFASDADFDTFVALVRKYQDAARTT